MQIRNAIAGAWHRAHWALPRYMPCTNTSPPLGPSDDKLGVNHGTVRQWLKLTPPDAATVAELSSTTGVLPIVKPPPAPWKDWDEVRRVREDLRPYRTLFLHQPENLTKEERQKLADLLTGPVGGELRVARTFLEEWFAIWQDDLGNRRTPHEAERQYLVWQADAEATKVAALRRQQQHLDINHFPTAECIPARPNVGAYQQCCRTRWSLIPPWPARALSASAAQIDRCRSEDARLSQEGALLLTSASTTSPLPARSTRHSD
jgi:hypothetical protein